jgi:hypothetical protein
MLTQLSLNKDLSDCEPSLLSIPCKLSKRRVDYQPSRPHDSTGGKGERSTLRQPRNFWLPWVTAILLACSSDAVAQTNYKVTDLVIVGNDNIADQRS